jgi:uncharacterized protein YjiK
MMATRAMILGAICVASSACGAGQGDAVSAKDREKAVLTARAARTTDALARADTGSSGATPIARWLMPASLKEISGIALTADGRLLAHDDSHGRVTEIDYRSGAIIKQFVLGPLTVKADFEGITVADASVFMLASNGSLYEFKEGKDGETVPYTIVDTGLSEECEFEGVVFDPRIKSLLLACKIVKDRSLRDSLVIYRWKLQDGLSRAARLSRLTVPFTAVAGANGWKTVHPSDITIDPTTGNYLIIASVAKALVEITPTGVVVSARPLPGEHAQAEGLAVTKDHILIVSDEAANGPAVITLYRFP